MPATCTSCGNSRSAQKGRRSCRAVHFAHRQSASQLSSFPSQTPSVEGRRVRERLREVPLHHLLLLLPALLPDPQSEAGLALLLEVDVGHEAHGAVAGQLVRLVRQGQLGDHAPLHLVLYRPGDNSNLDKKPLKSA